MERVHQRFRSKHVIYIKIYSPKERIEKIKKTWYKENIDPDYNSEYTNTQQSTNSSASTS